MEPRKRDDKAVAKKIEKPAAKKAAPKKPVVRVVIGGGVHPAAMYTKDDLRVLLRPFGRDRWRTLRAAMKRFGFEPKKFGKRLHMMGAWIIRAIMEE
ncbi:MAG TPA: hypothetical protein VGE52_01530 [Pirellulales bacterium]